MIGYVVNCKNSTERLRLFRENQFPFEVKVFEALEGDTPVERDFISGLSHLAILKSVTEFPVAVFEDDCLLLEPWELVSRAMSQLPPNWDALWLGATLQKPLIRHSENLYRLHSGHALHAVIYNSKEMVYYMINNFTRDRYKVLDVLTAYHAQKQFNCFITYPICATQRSCMSDINGRFLDNYNLIIDAYNKYTK
jgi:GR25 family glycosyltransferase involved in LPS biosynthesis